MCRWLGLLLAAALALSCVGALAGTAYLQSRLSRPASTAPAITATLEPAAEGTATPDTGRLLDGVAVPPRDSRDLAARLRPGSGPIPAVVNPQPPQHSAGDKARFWVSNSDTLEVFQVTATLRLVSRYTEMWVQDGIPVDQKALQSAAKSFDDEIYPVVRRYFGSEWTPGVDNDPQVTILNARFTGAAGYYSSHDEFSRQVNPHSNEREMFYMNADETTPGTKFYSAVLAHEFQHMVHWHMNSNETSWVNEGAAELAARLCGFGVTSSMGAFTNEPDTQLTSWVLAPDEEPYTHYGASYLWLEYFLQRMGPDALNKLVAEPETGIAGFDKVLAATPGAPSFDDLYADWVVANLLDDRALADGHYAYQTVNPHASVALTLRDLPAQQDATVHQYGTRYVAVVPRTPGPVKIEFSGSPLVPVVPNTPYEGSQEWWSNRGDMSDTMLTRAFDLTALKNATLQYALWYELEDGWDYGYLEVSTDGGATWKLLSTEHTSNYNPNGDAFGPGYTGSSGQATGSKTLLTPSWVQEKVDLTPYCGQRVLVRFEVVTDDAVNLPGLCLDNISIPELGFADGAEADMGWQTAGFVRTDNQLPQKYVVQVIEQGGQTRVERLQLDARQHGILVLDGLGRSYDQVVIAVSGLTRYTTEPARYNLAVTPAGKAP